MKKITTMIVFGILAFIKLNAQAPCWFDSLRIKSFNQDSKAEQDEKLFYYKLNLWRAKNKLNILPTPQPVPCENCLQIDPTCFKAQYVIPVIVHVVHLPSDNNIGTGSNISNTQVESQIESLNQYFANYKNNDPASVNTGIQFCLKQINRISSPRSNHHVDSMAELMNMKPNNLDYDKYMHIYVVNEIINLTGNPTGVQGYATFPSSGAQGIVIKYKRFGNDNGNNNVQSGTQGKVLVHEVGHYLGIKHPFEGGCVGELSTNCATQGDHCCDVPPVLVENTGCINTPVNSCTNDVPDLDDMLQNYMDYTSDACRTSFTYNQTEIMHFTLQTRRSNLVNTKHLNLLNLNCCLFSASFIAENTVLCDPDSVRFTALKYTNYNPTYRWIIRNSSGSVVHRFATSNHYYAWQVPNGVNTYSVTLRVILGGDSIEETKIKIIELKNCGKPIKSTQGTWYFGEYAGLRFMENAVIPDFELDNRKPNSLNTGEGCITLCDTLGRLLFYGGAKELGNGSFNLSDNLMQLFDKNHVEKKFDINNQPLELYSHGSCTQAAVAFPSPSDTNQFYLFTNQTAFERGIQNGLSFYKVQKNNQNQIQVTTTDSGFQNTSDESLIAVPSCNNNYWVLSGTQDKKISILKADSFGFKQHSLSSTQNIDIQGYMKTSPDGSLISKNGNIFKFNTQNGTIQKWLDFSDTFYIGEPPSRRSYQTNIYGASFSPNSKVFYYIEENVIGDGVLWQLDLTIKNPKEFKRKITEFPSGYLKSLQLAPNGRIYIAVEGSDKLAVINHPNNICFTNSPNACDFQDEGVYTQIGGIGGICNIGLPNMIDAKKPSQVKKELRLIQFKCDSLNASSNVCCASSYEWDFGDGSSKVYSKETKHKYAQNGTYIVTLVAGIITIKDTIDVGLQQQGILGKSGICDTFNALSYSTKKAPNPYFTYTWTSTNSVITTLSQTPYSSLIRWKENGSLFLKTENNINGCISKDTLQSVISKIVSNNVISYSSSGQTPCSFSKDSVTGSLPSGGNGTFQYKWYMSADNIHFTEMSQKTKNLILPKQTQPFYYLRLVNSNNCIIESNKVKVNIKLIDNKIYKAYNYLDSCTTNMLGTNVKKFLPNATYQWQETNDTNSGWSDIPYITSINYNYFYITDEIKFYRRKVTLDTCIVFSNILSNQSISITKPLKQLAACKGSPFPITVKYQINNPKKINYTRYWQYKTDTSNYWNNFGLHFNSDTIASIPQINAQTNGGPDFNLKIGDSLRIRYYYKCGSTIHHNYSNAIILEHIDTLKINTQPNNVTALSGNQARFIVGVNNPSLCTFKWQDSIIGGTWLDIPNSNNDSILISPGTCSDTLRYLRTLIYHPCGNKRSNVVKLTITPNSNPQYDYWMKDNLQDVGNEPNTTSTSYVSSEDIWIRNRKDDIKQHQEINTNYDTNYVYVTIRNKGKSPIKGASLYTYWTWGSTNEYWTLNWKNSDSNFYKKTPSSQDSFLKGSEINILPIILPEIPQYKTVEICIPFTNFPKLSWYDLSKTFNSMKINVCLLARIETCDKKPYGMAYSEIRDVIKNVRNNNNIITRNTYARYFGSPITGNEKDTATKRKPDELIIINKTNNGGGVIVTNQNEETMTTNICIKTSDSLFFTKATSYVELHPSLYNLWQTTSNTLSGLTHVTGSFFKITNNNACFNAIELPPYYTQPIDYHFGYNDLDVRFNKEIFNVSIGQYNENSEIIGECIYVISDNPFVEPFKEYIESDTTLKICYWPHDNNANNTVTYTADNSHPYSIKNGESILTPTDNNDYELAEGEYIYSSYDTIHNIEYISSIHVVNYGIDTNYTSTILSFDCENDTVNWSSAGNSHLVFDKNYNLQTPFTGNQFKLNGRQERYFEIHNNINTCKVDKVTIELQDLMYYPSSPIATMFADYDLSEDTCCTIEINEVNCNNQPIGLGEKIEIFNNALEYLYTTEVYQIGNHSQGFKFCPPNWDTTEAHINDYHTLIYKSSTCNYCRIDFKCDNTVVFDRQSSLSSIKNSDIMIFPNPTDNTLNVLLTQIVMDGSIIIFDALGKVILKTEFNNTNNKMQTIDVSNIPSGIYTLYLPEYGVYKKIVIVK